MEYTKTDLNWLMKKTEDCSERYMEAEKFILEIACQAYTTTFFSQTSTRANQVKPKTRWTEKKSKKIHKTVEPVKLSQFTRKEYKKCPQSPPP